KRRARRLTAIVIRSSGLRNMTSVATASPLELAILSFVILGLAGAAWWFAGFWGRMWTESLQSRRVDRRFLRWQRAAFRGHYSFGHWRKPWSLEHLRAFIYVWRAFVILIVLVWLPAVWHPVLAGVLFTSLC